MATHIKILGILSIVWGSALVLVGLLLLLFSAGLAEALSTRVTNLDPVVSILAIRSAGALAFAVLLILGAPGIIAGMGLLRFRPWARILAIVMFAIALLKFPFGTALGIYGLWALLSREGEMLFLYEPWERRQAEQWEREDGF